jgi:four helix bundle protein
VLELCDSIIEQLRKGRAHLNDQLDRAATSIVLNVAQGARRVQPRREVPFYRIARRSGTEAGAILHIYARRGHGPQEQIDEARALLVRIVSMLVRMTKSSSRT